MDEFERDLAVNTKDVETARASLVERLTVLTDEDLRRGRRGGWSIQEVLRHVIDARWPIQRCWGSCDRRRSN
jgi:hypothetical protein